MSDKGWIAIHRSIRNHWIYQENRTFSKYEAWIDLLLDANHKDAKIVFDGDFVEVNRGQRITSIRKLSEKWKWSRTKVTDFLNLLEKDEMLVKKSDSKKTVLTIVNYDFYQDYKPEKRQQSDTEVTQKSTNNNDITMRSNENKNNTSKKPKKRVYSDDDPNKILAKFLFQKISENQTIKEPDFDSWANTIRLTIESDKRSGKDVQDMIIWSTQHDFWSGVIQSPSSLRKHFDKMATQRKRDTSTNNKYSPNSLELRETGDNF